MRDLIGRAPVRLAAFLAGLALVFVAAYLLGAALELA